MNPLLSKVIINTVLNNKNKPFKKDNYSENELNKGKKELSISVKRVLKDVLFILVGILAAGFGLRGFLLPNEFIDGGAMGISLMVYELTKIPLSYLIVLVNLPFIILGIKVVNKTFAFKTIFGGFFLGTGIGLAIRGGSVIDGTEVLAIFASRQTGSSIGDIIMIINIIIFSFAAYLLSIETAMYAMLTYLSASKTVDFIVEGFEEYMGITVISDYSDEIRIMLRDELKRGYTVYKQKKGSGKKGEKIQESEIIYTVITRLEIGKLYSEIEKIDSDAFIITQSVKNIKGGLVKKRPLEDH
jgi:uncharacterized membrane-anchored protein YitT (DUF2179 family)